MSHDLHKSNNKNVNLKKSTSDVAKLSSEPMFSKALNAIKSVSFRPKSRPSRPTHSGSSSSSSLSASQTDCSLSARTIAQGVSAESKKVLNQSNDHNYNHNHNVFKPNNNSARSHEVDRDDKHQTQSQLLIIRECKEIIEYFLRLQQNSENATLDYGTESNFATNSMSSTDTDTPSVRGRILTSVLTSSGTVSRLIKPPKFSSSLETTSIDYNDINAVFIEVISKLYSLNDKIPRLLLNRYSQNDKIYKKQMLRLFGDSYYDSQYAIRANGRNYSHNADSTTDTTRTVQNDKDAKFYKSLGKRHNRYIGKYTFEELLNRKEATFQLCHAFVQAKHSFIYKQGNNLCVRHTPMYVSSNANSSQAMSLDSTRLSYSTTRIRSKSQSFGQFKHFAKSITVNNNAADGDKQRRESLSSTISDDAKDVVFNLSRSNFSEQNLLARRQQAANVQSLSLLQVASPTDCLRVNEMLSYPNSSSGININNPSFNASNGDFNCVHDDRSYKLRAMDAMMKLTSFDFDVFEFDVLTNGKSLSTLFPIMMEQLLFFDSGSNNSLRDSLTGHSLSAIVSNSNNTSDNNASSKNNEMIFNQDIVLNLISKIETLYNDFNPFYNRIHTSQMLCDCYFWLNQFDSTKINSLLKQEDRLIVLISSLIINLGYPGVNNSMLTSMNHDLAQIYNNQFVIENYAIAQFFYLLKHQSVNIFGKLQTTNKNKFKQIKKKIIQCVINANDTQRGQLTKSMKTSIQERKQATNFHKKRQDIGSNSTNDNYNPINGKNNNNRANKQKQLCKNQIVYAKHKPFLKKFFKPFTNNETSTSQLSAIALPADIADASKPDMLLVDSKDTVSKRLKKFKRAFSTKSSRVIRLNKTKKRSRSMRDNGKNNGIKKGSFKTNKQCPFDDSKRKEKDREILRNAIMHTSKHGYFCKNLKLHKEWSERYFQQRLISTHVFDQMMTKATLTSHGDRNSLSSSNSLTSLSLSSLAVNRDDFPVEMIHSLTSDEGFSTYFQTFADFTVSKRASTILMDITTNYNHWSSNEQAKVAFQGESCQYPPSA